MSKNYLSDAGFVICNTIDKMLEDVIECLIIDTIFRLI